MLITKQYLPSDLPPELPKGTGKEIDMMWGVKIPMRDGIRLNATVFKPHGQDGPLPVIFTFTPYISDSYYGYALTYAQRGFVYALVDVRGRGNSEGHFYPFMNEGPDGYDVVEWFATQPFCDGQVTMWGGSYAGFDQWLPASHFPPHLKTIVPVASGCFGVDFPFPHNIKTSYLIQWLTFTSGVTGNANLFGSHEFWTSKFTEMYREHRPFKELDQIVGNSQRCFPIGNADPPVDRHGKI